MHLKSYLLPFWNFWPPLFFSGIKIIKRSKDYREMTVKLKLRFWNSNYFGTQFGGAIYAMTDPFYMIMLIKNLGPHYQVMDKAAQIRYLKPGRTDLLANFTLSDEDLSAIRDLLEKQERMEWVRKIPIRDANKDIVAEVEKTISIKRSLFKQH